MKSLSAHRKLIFALYNQTLLNCFTSWNGVIPPLSNQDILCSQSPFGNSDLTDNIFIPYSQILSLSQFYSVFHSSDTMIKIAAVQFFLGRPPCGRSYTNILKAFTLKDSSPDACVWFDNQLKNKHCCSPGLQYCCNVIEHSRPSCLLGEDFSRWHKKQEQK